MKALISTLAVVLALAFTGPAFAGDVSTAKTEAEQGGWRHVGCCDQYVLREEDVIGRQSAAQRMSANGTKQTWSMR